MKKLWNENTYYLILFGLSCLNSNLIYVFLLLLFFQIRKGNEEYLKICLLYSLRQVFYFPGLAVITSTQSQIKLILLCMGAICVIIRHLITRRDRIPKVILGIILFGICAFISALGFGSYPVAGVVKVFNFVITMFAIMLAAIECKNKFNLELFIYRWLGYVMLISFFVLPFNAAYLRGSSGMLFRGIWNHPNDFGVACVIYMALIFSVNNILKIKQIIQIVAVFVMIFQSNSRGAMIGAILLVTGYLFLCRNVKNSRTMLILVACCMFIVFITPLKAKMTKFFVKNSFEQNVSLESFSSREDIVEVGMKRFRSNPFFGRGLLISYEPDKVSFIFSEDGTEPGNIFVELLAGTGIVGLATCLYMFFSFYKIAPGGKKILVMAVIFASISEVSFFSVNNYACLYYLLFAITIECFYKEQEENTNFIN